MNAKESIASLRRHPRASSLRSLVGSLAVLATSGACPAGMIGGGDGGGGGGGGGGASVAGACGSAGGQALSAAPSGGALCSAGPASAVAGSGPWSWTCAGFNGGTTASCSATLASGPVNGACGSANGGRFGSAPSGSALCSAGTASTLAGSGPWSWTCAGFNGGTTASCSASRAQSAGTVNLGINLGSLNYWMEWAPFVDLARGMCANDDAVCFDGPSGAVAVNADGYPTSAGALTATWAPYPAGDYAMTWDGASDGSTIVTLNDLSSGVTITTPTRSGVHYSATVHLAPSAAETSHLVINVPPGISNLHILAPSSLYDAGHTYLRDFLRRLQPFSTLRFMDTLRINGSTVSRWSERAFPGDFSHARKNGIAYEDIVTLANESGKDVWIPIPVFATDDYICRLARLLRYGEPGDRSDASCNPDAPSSATGSQTGINSSSHIYLEYSNELWNYSFDQAHAMVCMATGHNDHGGSCDGYGGRTAPTSAFAAAALANEHYPWSADNVWGKAAQLHGVMLVNISQTFGKVFHDRPGQVRVVAGSQNAGSANVILDMVKGAYGDSAISQHLYAIAVAPYLDVESDDDLDASLLGVDKDHPPAGLDLSSLFASIDTYIWTTDGSKASLNLWTANNAEEAAKYGLKLISYEGGPGLTATGRNDTFGAKYLAQYDPGMRKAMLDAFSVWTRSAGEDALFTYYDFVGGYGTFGYWGALESTRQRGSVKWDTLMSLTRPTGDATLDDTVDQRDCAILRSNFGGTGKHWEEGDFNLDGTVDGSDLALLNANMVGALCSAP